MKRIFFFALLIVSLSILGTCYGDTALTESQYRSQISPDIFPETLNVNIFADCGDLQIRVMGQPSVSVSTSGIHAYGDKSYLILRVGIKNLSEEPVIWLDPESFHVQEYYLDIFGETYNINPYMSAKAAQGYNLPAFFSVINPQQELLTMLVFEVYGEVDGWIMTFSPFTREFDEAQESITFTLPKAGRY